MKYLRIAFNLLTTLPIPAPKDWQPGDSGRAAPWYPFVGLVIGALTAGAWWAASLIFPPLICAGLALMVWSLLTGGLHLDGLADCCDGLFHASDAERRLAIMKDSHLGAIGAIGLGITLLLKFAGLASLPPEGAIFTIMLAASLSRWFILLAGMQPSARPGGMGADFTSGLKKPSVIWGALIPLALCALLGLRSLLALIAAFLAAFALLGLARKQIGGVTGDVFGFIVEVIETLTLLTLCIRL